MSPTAKTLKHLRLAGFTADVVERWIPGANIRRDFLGIIDIIGVCQGQVLGVQATSDSNIAARRAKALAEPRLRSWLDSGACFQIHGWSGKSLRIVTVTRDEAGTMTAINPPRRKRRKPEPSLFG